MNKYIVTAPDGTIHKRNTQSHTYNYVVLYMQSKETKILGIKENIAIYNGYLARAHDLNNEENIVRYTDLIALSDSEMSAAKDTWFVEGWRRDLKAAEQLANKLATHPRVDQAIVLETTQIN